jgi:hypothetical protein
VSNFEESRLRKSLLLRKQIERELEEIVLYLVPKKLLRLVEEIFLRKTVCCDR